MGGANSGTKTKNRRDVRESGESGIMENKRRDFSKEKLAIILKYHTEIKENKH